MQYVAWRRPLTDAKNYITAQGEMVYAANMLQESYYELFRVALSLERPDEFGAEIRFHQQALAIWHIVQSDSSQREMALSAIASVPSRLRLAPAIRRLQWATNKAGKLATYRNILIHNPIMFATKPAEGPLKWVPVLGSGGSRPAHKSRLRMIGGLGLWRTIRSDLLRLSDYVHNVNQQIRRMEAARFGATLMGVPVSWPKRPLLRSLPRLREIDTQLEQESQKAKRRTRRRSSQT
jgi:hypothetical protein